MRGAEGQACERMVRAVITRIAHVYPTPMDETELWEAREWQGNKAFVTPAAWHRYWEFHGQTMTVIVMSDNWALSYDEARRVAIEIATGRRTYWSYDLNEDKPTWHRIW